MGDAQPFSVPFSGTTDANGNASVSLSGFQAGVPAAFNLSINIQGNAPFIAILQGVFQLAAANAINGDAQIGSVITDGSSPLSVTITGALPSTTFSGIATGIQSSDPQDLAAITGQTSLTVGTVTAYDGSTLIGENSVQHVADVTYGTFDVRLWASVLLGLRLASGGPLLITFRWYANPDASRLVGQRAMLLNTDVPTLIATIPNLGPYLQVVVGRITGGQFQWNASLLTSQRIVPDLFGGNFTPYLLETSQGTIAASTTVNFFLGTVYGGPSWVSVRNFAVSPGTISVTLDPLGTDGSYHLRLAAALLAIGSGSSVNQIVVLPPVPVRVQIVSAATAGNYTFDIDVYTTSTGSS